MSLPAMINSAARTPYSEAASLAHYSGKTDTELKILAKVHGISDAAQPWEIVAALMERDRSRGVWPGMFDYPKTEEARDTHVAPVKQTSEKAETPSESKVAAVEQSKSASAATVSNKIAKVAKTPTVAMTATGSEDDTAFPMSELRKEWDGLWGPPFAFSKVAAAESTSQGTSVATAGSTSTRSKSPPSPASPASLVSPSPPASPVSPAFPISAVSSASSRSNRFDVVATEEDVIEVIEEEIPIAEENIEKAPSVHQESLAIPPSSQQSDGEDKLYLAKENAGVVEKTKKKAKRGKKGGKKVNKAKTNVAQSPETEAEKTEASTSDAAVASKQAEDVPLPVSPATAEFPEDNMESALEVSKSNPVVEDIEESSSPIEVPTPRQPATSSPTTPYEPTVKPPKKAHVEIFPVASPCPPPSAQTAPAPIPSKTKNQRRNEKRKENKQAATLSNMYDVLMSDQSADVSAPDSSNIKEDEHEDNGEGTAPTAKKNKRGTKGGKKAQAQKKHQPVPIFDTTATPIAETGAGPIVEAAVAANIQPMHLALAAVVAILAGALGTWAVL